MRCPHVAFQAFQRVSYVGNICLRMLLKGAVLAFNIFSFCEGKEFCVSWQVVVADDMIYSRGVDVMLYMVSFSGVLLSEWLSILRLDARQYICC